MSTNMVELSISLRPILDDAARKLDRLRRKEAWQEEQIQQIFQKIHKQGVKFITRCNSHCVKELLRLTSVLNIWARMSKTRQSWVIATGVLNDTSAQILALRQTPHDFPSRPGLPTTSTTGDLDDVNNANLRMVRRRLAANLHADRHSCLSLVKLCMFGLPEANDEPNLLNVAGSQIVAGVFKRCPQYFSSRSIYLRLERSSVTMALFYEPGLGESSGQWVFSTHPVDAFCFATLDVGGSAIRGVPLGRQRWVLGLPTKRSKPIKYLQIRTMGDPDLSYLLFSPMAQVETVPANPSRKLSMQSLLWRFKVGHTALSRQAPVRMKDENRSDLVVFNAVWFTQSYFPWTRIEFMIFRGQIADTWLDIGANNGLLARWALTQGARHVDCYEPCRENFAVLMMNTVYFDNIHIYPFAVGTRNGHTIMSDHTDDVAGSLRNCVKHHNNRKENGDEYKVRLVSFNDILTHAHDVLKLDCEGSELDILLCPGTDYKSLLLVLAEISGKRLRDFYGVAGWRVFGSILKQLDSHGFHHIHFDSLASNIAYWHDPSFGSKHLDIKLWAYRQTCDLALADDTPIAANKTMQHEIYEHKMVLQDIENEVCPAVRRDDAPACVCAFQHCQKYAAQCILEGTQSSGLEARARRHRLGGVQKRSALGSQ